MTEGRDWTRTQFEPCPDCWFDPDEFEDRHLGRALTDAAAAWGRLLAVTDDGLLRIRPEPHTWSAIEYACHVRDAIAVFDDRVRRALAEESQALGWWDHEAAVVDGSYESEVAVLVAEAIGANARVFASTLATVAPANLDRAAVRRSGEHFTIRGMGRFILHEVVHHRLDAQQGLDSLT